MQLSDDIKWFIYKKTNWDKKGDLGVAGKYYGQCWNLGDSIEWGQNKAKTKPHKPNRVKELKSTGVEVEY